MVICLQTHWCHKSYGVTSHHLTGSKGTPNTAHVTKNLQISYGPRGKQNSTVLLREHSNKMIFVTFCYTHKSASSSAIIRELISTKKQFLLFFLFIFIGNPYLMHRKLQMDNVQRVRNYVTLCPTQDVSTTPSPQGSRNCRRSRKIVEPLKMEDTKKPGFLNTRELAKKNPQR